MNNFVGLSDHPLKVPTTIVPGDHIIPLEVNCTKLYYKLLITQVFFFIKTWCSL